MAATQTQLKAWVNCKLQLSISKSQTWLIVTFYYDIFVQKYWSFSLLYLKMRQLDGDQHFLKSSQGSFLPLSDRPISEPAGKKKQEKIKKWSNKCLEWKLAWNTAVTFTTLHVELLGDEWKRKLMTKLKSRILEQKQMKVQPSETVRFVSRVTYPADWAETLVDSAVPVTGSRVLVFGWQNFVTSVEVCNKKRGTSCQTRDGH